MLTAPARRFPRSSTNSLDQCSHGKQASRPESGSAGVGRPPACARAPQSQVCSVPASWSLGLAGHWPAGSLASCPPSPPWKHICSGGPVRGGASGASQPSGEAVRRVGPRGRGLSASKPRCTSPFPARSGSDSPAGPRPRPASQPRGRRRALLSAPKHPPQLRKAGWEARWVASTAWSCHSDAEHPPPSRCAVLRRTTASG